MSFRILIILLILIGIDFYVFQGMKVAMRSNSLVAQKNSFATYWTIAFLCIAFVLLAVVTDWHSWNKMVRTYVFAFVVVIYLSKIVVVPFLVIDDVIRLSRWTIGSISELFSSSDSPELHQGHSISRTQFIVKLGLFAGAIPFVSLIYGMIRGAYNYQVRNVALKFSNLPGGFNGFKILQFSDLHLGSFTTTHHLEKAVQLILEQKPDVVFFTGDLVNDRHAEVLEFSEILKKIKAPMGVFSILGNHDYGDYYKWNSPREKKENFQRLIRFHTEAGWNILLNGHTFLERGEEKIGLIGVENWSARSNFHRYGDLKAATAQMNPAPFNILLSHDPSHWNAEITKDYPFVDLTLSGHTHGFQFGVEIPGFKWSPVQYFYKEWADLYQKNHQYLYVNRGLGFIGYPGRVGILPEITVFTLHQVS